MATSTTALPLVEQLMETEGKAEILGGEVVEYMSTGGLPGYAGDEIYAFLREYARRG